jgi:pimeloyl-ACP methyl ester carboxylesterase
LGRALHQQLAGSQFKLIHGVGHVPMWEKPQEFNQAALQFLVPS